MSVAYGKRDRLAIRRRRVADSTFRTTRRVVRRLKGRSPNEQFEAIWVVLPALATFHDVERVRNRVGWYFGSRSDQFAHSTPTGVVCPTELWSSQNELPDSESDTRPWAEVSRVVSPESFSPGRRDLILLWSARSIRRARAASRIDRSFVIDPTFYSETEFASYAYALTRTASRHARDEIESASQQNLAILLERVAGASRAYAVGTGPSASELLNRQFAGDEAVVVCNSIVRNGSVLDHLRPVAICFADPVFHWGPSAYAEAFRADLMAALDRTDAFAVTHWYAAYTLIRHYPSLLGRLIIAGDSPRRSTTSTRGQLHLGPRGNVLTSLMIPLASLMSDEIHIAGCDGRKPDENYFWKHDATVQYEGLMKSAFETHPAFFRDRVYSDYYASHCISLEKQISTGERAGKRFASVTTSYIPALVARSKKRAE